jgi:transposase-like protein
MDTITAPFMRNLSKRSALSARRFSPEAYVSRVEVITSVQRRRRWSAAEKIRLIEEASQPGMSVSYVARRAGIALFAKTKGLHLRPLDVSQNEPVYQKLESQPSSDENPKSQQTLERISS